MQNLTEAERAYRRGALQSNLFLAKLLAAKQPATIGEVSLLIGRYHLELTRGRVSTDNKYLGAYLDQILKEIE